VGPRVGLDVCEKSRPYLESIPGPSIPKPVAILTELFRPPPGEVLFKNVCATLISLSVDCLFQKDFSIKYDLVVPLSIFNNFFFKIIQ
jgi:hypothetical protein